MFAVNRFVIEPNDTVSASAQNHEYELAERLVGLLAGSGICKLRERDCRITDSRVCADYSSDTRNSWLTQFAAG